MTILIIGKNGQVGQSLSELFSTDDSIVNFGRVALDLALTDTIAPTLEKIKPDIIINAAAYTAVDHAESDQKTAYLINHSAVSALADYSFKNNTLLIHYSTDYVFDGHQMEPYSETATTNPLSVYGKSKRMGEEAIISSHCPHLIFRTSWVHSPHGKNFPKTILNLAGTRDQLSVINDQHGSPTCSKTIAQITKQFIRKYSACNSTQREDMHGLYHLTEQGVTSWYDFARFLIDGAIKRGAELKCSSDQIYPISTVDFGATAPRPQHSSLDCSKLSRELDLELPSWQISADCFLDILIKRNL